MDDIPMKRNRRSGGRSARKLKRAAPLPDNIKPIGPGMIGGTYKPLSQSDISAIEQTIFQLLNEVGLSQSPDTCLLYTSPSPRDKRQSRMPSSA